MKKDAKTVAVIGAGMMASGMATLCCGHGYKTMVLCRSQASAEKCAAAVDRNYRQMAEHGLLTPERAEICKSYIVYTCDYAELRDAFAVFECITEDLEQKHLVYRQLDESCPALEMVCSLTSSLVPEKLAAYGGKYADRIVVTHPFNPVHLAPYFEICQCGRTREGVGRLEVHAHGVAGPDDRYRVRGVELALGIDAGIPGATSHFLEVDRCEELSRPAALEPLPSPSCRPRSSEESPRR